MTPLSPTSTLFPYTTLFRSPDKRSGPARFFLPLDTPDLLAGPFVQRDEKGLLLVVVQDVDAIFVKQRRRTGSPRSEEHTSELQSPMYLVCRLLLEKKKLQLT